MNLKWLKIYFDYKLDYLVRLLVGFCLDINFFNNYDV